MHGDFLGTSLGSRFDQSMNVGFVAMHATIRNQAQHMQRFVSINRGIDRGLEYFVLANRAFSNINVNPANILQHHPPSADIQVAHFGIAELAFRQTDKLVGCIDQCPWIFSKKAVDIRLLCRSNGIVFFFFAIAKTIENQQQNRLHGIIHIHDSGVGMMRVAKSVLRDGNCAPLSNTGILTHCCLPECF